MNALDSIFWHENADEVREVAHWASSPDVALLPDLEAVRDYLSHPWRYEDLYRAWAGFQLDQWTPEVIA